MEKDFFYLILTIISISMAICIVAPVSYHQGKLAGAEMVYEGKTKLKYTVVDNVKTDSCVIFLKNDK